MDYGKRIAHEVRKTFNLRARFARFRDIRKNPRIPLRTILLSLFLMPFFGHRSLLGLDRACRSSEYKRLLGSKRSMVASDSTFARVLRWLDGEQVVQFQRSFLQDFQSADLLRRRLVDGAPLRRLGIIDGSCMGGHWISSLCLSGKINYPVIVRPYRSRGDELGTASEILDEVHSTLGTAAPELYLLDALYFTRPIFTQVKALKAHLLIKLKDAEYREVTKDAQNLFDHFGGDREQEGFDSSRWCHWSMQQTIGQFAGQTVQVVHLHEYYPKRTVNKTLDCWIVTTDLSLTLPEIREAAHLRWQIENNLFKRLNHLSGTKRFYFKDQRRFINLLCLLAAAVALLDALIYSLARKPQLDKVLRDGIKPTWLNLFSRMQELLFIHHTVLY